MMLSRRCCRSFQTHFLIQIKVWLIQPSENISHSNNPTGKKDSTNKSHLLNIFNIRLDMMKNSRFELPFFPIEKFTICKLATNVSHLRRW